MTAFISWYLLITLLGLLAFPLVYRLFPALADRGYTLSRAAGLLLWGYLFWMLASLGIAQNDMGGLLLALALLIGLSAWQIVKRGLDPSRDERAELLDHQPAIVNFFKSNLSLVITTEILFFIAFAFLAFVRSANPELTGTERPMELAFINAILRSPAFPPQDPWLSGYAISYYYFGYVMTAMLARFTGILGSAAHNLMTSLVFALGAIGSYGILYNLLSSLRASHHESSDHANEGKESVTRNSQLVTFSLFAPIFLLLISNFGALLEVLHQSGLFWKRDPATGEHISRFWKWLDMKELSAPPALPFHVVPDRYLWWWRSSRVLQDHDMLFNPQEVIDEFPFFSFLLGDLHPHVLAIPFGLLAISAALNLFLGGWRGRINLPLGAQLRINLPGFLFIALLLGGLAFLNTWDILIAAVLIVASYVLRRANEDGWRWDRLEDVFLLGLPLGVLSIFLYLPFYVGFSSQAGGILPSLMYPTRGAHLWTMWGTLLIPIFAWLIYLWRGEKVPADWGRGFALGLGFVSFLWVFSWLLGWVGFILEKNFVNAFLASQGMDAGQFFAATSLRRLSYIGGLITMLAVFIPALSFSFPRERQSETTILESANLQSQITNPQSSIPFGHDVVNRQSSIQFAFFLLTLGALLIIVPDFVYLRDKFGYRINTVFKFYYQAWMLWSLVAAFAVAYLFQNLRGVANAVFRATMGLVFVVGLLYPIFGLNTKTNGFNPPYGFTFDDFDRIIREDPDEAAAINFLRAAPDGVIAEAIGDSYNYPYTRISTHTGLQTVLGWPGHEDQWRGSYGPQGSRRDDIFRLYTTPRWEEALAIIQQYGIRYIYIGLLERSSMPVNEEKFQANLKVIFQQGGTVIYEAPVQE